MKKRQRKKLTLRHCPRWLNGAPRRKDGLYFEDWCCEQCYWDWGWTFEDRHCYKTDCRESNYKGLLKKYWKTSDINYFEELNEN